MKATPTLSSLLGLFQLFTHLPLSNRFRKSSQGIHNRRLLQLLRQTRGDLNREQAEGKKRGQLSGEGEDSDPLREGEVQATYSGHHRLECAFKNLLDFYTRFDKFKAN